MRIQENVLFENKLTNHVIVFVSNKSYFTKFIETCTQLINTGKYVGDICLIVTDDCQDVYDHPFITKNNIIVKHFPDIDFPEEFKMITQTLNRPYETYTKSNAQYHKMHVFNRFFKKWDYVFYLDCGMKIHSNINSVLKLFRKNILLGHSDAYPTYEWKLSGQFSHIEPYFTHLTKRYNLNIDYFQSGILMFHTNLINDNTFDELYKLAIEYPISRTNEQGIMNIYFNCIHGVWKQIPIGYYDYTNRNGIVNMITKS